ncbi:unnamed protein product [Rotaria sp. Silwood2]|nr:unnamed protein product [Rotaria sp. Silwood2]
MSAPAYQPPYAHVPNSLVHQFPQQYTSLLLSPPREPPTSSTVPPTPIWNGYVFRRFDHWLNSDMFCAIVNGALSEDIEELNGFVNVSDGVKWHRSA